MFCFHFRHHLCFIRFKWSVFVEPLRHSATLQSSYFIQNNSTSKYQKMATMHAKTPPLKTSPAKTTSKRHYKIASKTPPITPTAFEEDKTDILYSLQNMETSCTQSTIPSCEHTSTSIQSGATSCDDKQSPSFTASSSLMDAPILNLSFAGCGFLGIYHLGVARTIIEHGPTLLQKVQSFGGASAGSLIASVFLIEENRLQFVEVNTYIYVASKSQK